jgi:hypothetical protein
MPTTGSVEELELEQEIRAFEGMERDPNCKY